MASLAAEPARYAEGIGVAARSKGRDNESTQVSVQLVGRHHNTGPRLADLPSPSGTERDEEDVASSDSAYRQRHSWSSNCVPVGSSSRRSSPRSRICRAASAHPARGRLGEVMTSAFPRIWTSTSSCRPASSISGLGSRTPREFPMRMSRDFIHHHREHIVLTWAYCVKRANTQISSEARGSLPSRASSTACGCYAAPRSARVTAFGSAEATRRRASAGPSGVRRPCSQLRSVAMLTPIMSANSLCDLPSLLRIAFTSAGANVKARDAFAPPRRMRPACRTLRTN
jgi:hypothetical protein